MTKKRFKFGLAILGGMAAFLLALLALVFAPTLASAGKGPVFGQEQDGGSHHGHPNPAYFEPPTGNGNDPHHTQGGSDPCAQTPNSCNAPGAPGEEPWFRPGGEGGHDGNHGDNQGNPSGHDSGSNGGQGNPQGNPSGFFAGGPWGPGGGGGGGGGDTPHDQSHSCSSDKDSNKSDDDKKSDEKTCDKDDQNNDDNGNKDGGSHHHDRDDTGSTGGIDITTNFVNTDLPPGDDTDNDPPVDPNCFPFGEGCGPQGNNPPNAGPTDETTDVPEPLTLSLFAAGLAGAATLRRRQKKANFRAD